MCRLKAERPDKELIDTMPTALGLPKEEQEGQSNRPFLRL
jgi:hypothetical protein